MKRASDPEITWTYSPSLAPGEYPAFCRHAKIYRDRQFKRWVCAVQFDVLESGLVKVLAQLTWYLNMGDGESHTSLGEKSTGRPGFWLMANSQDAQIAYPRVFSKDDMPRYLSKTR
jgi:hypothetical protein